MKQLKTNKVNIYHFKASWFVKGSLVITEGWSHSVWLISIANIRQFDEYYVFLSCFSKFWLCSISINRNRRRPVLDNSVFCPASCNHHLKHHRKSNVLPLLSNIWIPIGYVICLFSFRKVSSQPPFCFKNKAQTAIHKVWNYNDIWLPIHPSLLWIHM